MELIHSETELRLRHMLRPLEPFGIEIHASSPVLPSSLSSSLLASLFAREKLVLLRGFTPFDRDGLLSFCLSYPRAELLHWEFGPVMEMKEDPAARNYLFSSEAVPFHWDGAFHRVPSILVFNCLQAPTVGTGGETLFCDTERVWAAAPTREKLRWSDLTLAFETEKKAHYGGKIRGKLVQTHPHSGRRILRFAEPVTTRLNPVSLTAEGMSEDATAGFLEAMRERIYHPSYCYAHRWREGDLLLADNHALIHGRRAFTSGGPRHLRRVQIL